MHQSANALKMAKRAARAHQKTFSSPLKDLERFVDTVLSGLPGIEAAQVVLESVVFEPQYRLAELTRRYGFSPSWRVEGLVFEAEGDSEIKELLLATLSEWIDFCFVPAQRRIMAYADHDEFITFFAEKEPQLDRIVTALLSAGFKQVEYIRKL